MTTIISIEGSSREEKLCVFYGLKCLGEKNVYFLEDWWELSNLSNLTLVLTLARKLSSILTLVQNSVRFVVTFYSPFTVHQYYQKNIIDTGVILTQDIIEIMDSNLLQSHSTMIYLSPHSESIEGFLLKEGRTLLRYRALFGYKDEIQCIANAILNYIGFVNLSEEDQEKWLTQNQNYKPGVNYGKVGFFTKFGTVSYKTFYSGDSPFPYTLSCFTTEFHE